jgi:hypothetical protein
VVAVGTGGAYAADTIGSSDVIDESLLSQDIKNGNVARVDMANNSVIARTVLDGSLGGEEITDSSISGEDVLDESLTGADVALGELTTFDIADGTIGTVDVGPDSLRAGNLHADSVASSEIAASAVGFSEMGNDSVGGAEVRLNSLGPNDIGSIGTDEVIDGGLKSGDVGLLSGEFTYDPPEIGGGDCLAVPISVSPNLVDDPVLVSVRKSFPDNLVVTARTTFGEGVFELQICNVTPFGINAESNTFSYVAFNN